MIRLHPNMSTDFHPGFELFLILLFIDSVEEYARMTLSSYVIIKLLSVRKQFLEKRKLNCIVMVA